MENKLYKSSLRSEDKIGRGGFGTVFKGHQKNHNRTPVAIKRIENDADYVTEDAMKDFEAMLAVCGHDNIVQLLDLHVQPDFIFIIMEYCNRGDLDRFLSEGVPSYRVKLDIMRQCAAGVSYIHGLSPPVVHRDLKPQNILLHEAPSGVICVKLCDFGLAKVFSDMTGSIGAMYMSTLGGTRPFMAPEMWISERRYTAMVDNYALGLVFAVIVNYSDSDKERLPQTAGVAREPYLSYGLRQSLAHNEHRPPPSLYMSPQFEENQPRMKALIVEMTSFDAKQRTKMQKIKSEIDLEISDEHGEEGGAAGGSPVSTPGSHRRTDRTLGSIKQITPVKKGSFTIRNKCIRFCSHKNVLYFPCFNDGCIDCYSMEGRFIRSIDLNLHQVNRPNSAHPLSEDSLLVAAHNGLYEVGTGEGGDCRLVLDGIFDDVHVSEGVVAVLEEQWCHGVHILHVSDLSSPVSTITLTYKGSTTVLIHQDSLYVSSWYGTGLYDIDYTQHDISVYSLSTGERTAQYGRHGHEAAGELARPHLSACDADGGMLVVDEHNCRLQTLSARGDWAVVPGLGEGGYPEDAVIVGDQVLVLDEYQTVHAYQIIYKSESEIEDTSTDSKREDASTDSEIEDASTDSKIEDASTDSEIEDASTDSEIKGPSKSNSEIEDASKSNSETKDTSKPNSKTKDTSKSNSETKDTSKSNSETKVTSKSNSETKDTSKSNSETKDTSKSNSETKDTSKSNSKTKDTSKSNSETKDTSKSNSETKDTSKSNSETKDTSKSNSETKDTSKSNSETKDSSKSDSEKKDTSKSNSETKDTSKSNSETKDTRKSNSETKDTSKSNSETKDTSKSNSETKDTSKSNSETKDTSKSNSETKDSSKSDSEKKDTSKSNSETKDTSKSNSETKDTRKSNSETKDTSKSNSETKDTSKSDSETKDTSKSNSKMCLIS